MTEGDDRTRILGQTNDKRIPEHPKELNHDGGGGGGGGGEGGGGMTGMQQATIECHVIVELHVNDMVER